MNEPAINDLMQRLNNVETQNRRYLYIAICVLLAGMGLFVMGQAKTRDVKKVVEAEKFILRDAQGKIRAGLALNADGALRLLLADQEGNPRADLSVLDNGRAGLSLIDKNGVIRAGLTTLPTGAPDFGLADAEGNVRVGIGFDKRDGSPALAVYNTNKSPVWRAP